ncbi:MmcQ/YjbR family DNA-binding protein [Acetanaerobacterium elongatum]|uniref:Predicted DNA-binding protein, MmcQ/YjbR family n=1 Tax=Acetanaerobacterium elongatum TaxID=258515 RepID=A0A1G9VAD9_9FIRM|nr:MmcQ/YjbR family DNA-binding protein [Acetanaerobacterium elongatum]SDM69053.1 Predicted DNA-binding protein, MmcQ/YjbR family [Acetanaerobacterium elongatum]
MSNEDIIRYCLAKPGAYEDYPFGPIPACYKVCGKLFMQLYPMPENHKISLSCEPMLADFYRRQYPGIVIPGYHCPDRLKPYMNTVYLDKGVADEQVWEMINHSYRYVVNKLTRKEKAALAEFC